MKNLAFPARRIILRPLYLLKLSTMKPQVFFQRKTHFWHHSQQLVRVANKYSNKAIKMFPILRPISHLFKRKQWSTESLMQKLHYKVTIGLFVFAVICTSAQQLIKDPIICSPTQHVVQRFMDAYCWMYPSFVITQTQR